MEEGYIKRLVELAYSVKEPFTALLVDEEANEVIAEGYAKVSQGQPLFHGEIDALQNAVNKVGMQTLSNRNRLTIYTTGEPCPMCAGACIWFGVSRIVYGTCRPLLLELGWDDTFMRCEEVTKTAKKPIQVLHCKAEESDKLFKSFTNKHL